MASAVLKRMAMLKSMARNHCKLRAFALVAVGTDMVAAAPDVSLQKARSWDKVVSSKFSTTALKDILKDKKVVIFGLPKSSGRFARNTEISQQILVEKEIGDPANATESSQAALPGMKNREGHGSASIAIMSSQAGQVGIYGYTAYSASKFGLKGMAEALYQEVIANNIHVSLIFPPDTETPGFVEENKRRPQLTGIIAASSGAMKVVEVSKKALSGIKNGSFIVPCNFEGFLLSIATTSLFPQRSFPMAFVEVVTTSIACLAALFFQWNWYGSIEKWHATKN